jgi:hypothetical protein
MANPPPYVPSFSFSGFQETNPTDPPPGPMLDNEYDNISESLNQTITALSSVRRSDGALVNGIVTPESLSSDLTIGVQTPTAWVTAHAYVAGNIVVQSNTFYLCLVSHTSGVFATDLAAVKWVSVTLSITGYSADQVTYDHTISGLAAVNVKTAIDEVDADVDALQALQTFVPKLAQGRLTLETGVPVSTSDQLAKGTIYYTPYVGNLISLYSGTTWVTRAFGEISLALTATSGKPYDVFVYDNAGAAALETLVWTNDTTRATALVRQDGVWCKTGALTRRYVGTFYASATDQCEDSQKKRYVWNMYNRVWRGCRSPLETTDSWPYSSAVTRQANASTANQFDFVRGLDEDIVSATLITASSNSVVGNAMYSGIGLDITTAFATDCAPVVFRAAVANMYGSVTAAYSGQPGIGRHFLTWLERGDGGTATWLGDNGGLMQSGMRGSVFA